MKKKSKNSVGFTFALTLLLAANAQAERVEFTSKELQAGYTLIRPESTGVTLDGRKGVFEPAPALRYFGIESEVFEIDLNLIADVVDLRFDRLVARMPEIRFLDGVMEIEVPFEDRAKALRSSVGSISTRGVSVTVILHWKESSSGLRELHVRATRFKGTLKGTGLLAMAEGKLKSLAMKIAAEKVQKQLRKTEIQEAIHQGLSQWAKLAQGDRQISADAATFEFFGKSAKDGSSGGVRFEAR